MGCFMVLDGVVGGHIFLSACCGLGNNFLGLSVSACLSEVLLLVSIHMPGVLSLLPAARVFVSRWGV